MRCYEAKGAPTRIAGLAHGPSVSLRLARLLPFALRRIRAFAPSNEDPLPPASVPEQRDQDDDGNRYTQQVEKNRLHGYLQSVQ
jgi:hypothetical protein